MSQQGKKAAGGLKQIMNVRLEKMDALRERGVDPFGHRFDITHHINEIIAQKDALIQSGEEVKIAGRIMEKRGQGKAGFANVADISGNIQIYCRQDILGEEEHWFFKKADIGDIVGITGVVFVTDRGELSIKVHKYDHLCIAMRPLPEKFHGLTDTELRYRQRYVALIMNPGVKNTFIMRSKLVTAIRSYLARHAFLEVETPVLHTIAGGANARPFITHHNALDIDLYMRIAFNGLGDMMRCKDGKVMLKDLEQMDTQLIESLKVDDRGVISLKTADRMKALQWLSNYFELNPSDRHRAAYQAKMAELREREDKSKEEGW